MKLKYELTSVERAKKCQIVNRSHVDKVDYVYGELDKQHKKLLRSSCFGDLISLPAVNGAQIVHNMLMRQVESDSKEVFWFRVGNNQAVRFSLKEFTLITGLNVGKFEWKVSEKKAQGCRLVKRYFKKLRLINRNDLLKVFPGVADENDKFKLGLLIILCFVLLAAEEKVSLDWWWFKLVDDLDSFNKYPWGILCYEYTVRVFNRDLSQLFKKEKVPYTLNGFPLALMVWALESIPCLRSLADSVDTKALPRMRKWTLERRVSSSSVNGLLQQSQVECFPTLVVNNSEKSKRYYVGLLEVCEEEAEVNVEGGVEGAEVNVEGIGVEGAEVNVEGVGVEERDEEELGEEERYEVNVNQPSVSDMDKLKDEIIRAVKEENKCLQSQLEAIRRKVDSLESIAKKVVCENCRASINKDTVESEERKESDGEEGVNVDDDMVGGDEVGGQSEGPEREQCEGEGEVEVEVEGEGEGEGEAEGDNVMVGEDKGREQCKAEGKKVLGKTKPTGEPSYPYFQNFKRRRLDRVSVFDPHRELEPELIKSLDTFMYKEENSKSVRLVAGDVGALDLKAVVDGGWLTTPIMNAAFCEISLRQKAYPELFQQDARVLDTYFAILMTQMHAGMNKDVTLGNLSFDKKLLKYVGGENPVGGQPWSGCRYLYIPMSERDHWFLLKVDLHNRMIYVYDSLKDHIRLKILQSRVMPLEWLIPYLVRKHVEGCQNYPVKKFTMERVKCPIQENGSDCGMYTIKFLEYMLANMNVDTIDRRHMTMWRRKLVAELLASQFVP